MQGGTSMHYVEKHQFKVVSAVYNVEDYLNDYFSSLINQTLDFKSHIKVTLIDDGSTDNSASIIKTWQKKYPGNINYIKKEHEGLAAVRNKGLQYVSGDWVTFIDTDDFISKEYFEKVDRFLNDNKAARLGMIACNYIIYNENEGRYKNHPLSYRFEQGNRIISAKDPGDFIQLTVSSIFLKSEVLKNTGLNYDERIKPNFSDANFIARYLIGNPDLNIGIVADAKYYYRKRGTANSIIDTKKRHPGYYSNVLKYGMLPLLQLALEKEGHVPFWLQHTILNEIAWRFKEMVNDGWYEEYLSEEQKSLFLTLMQELMDHIDMETVDKFSLANLPNAFKAGILRLFKGSDGLYKEVKIDEHDNKRAMLRLSYVYCGNQLAEKFYIGDNEIIPVYRKNIGYRLLGKLIAKERIIWLSYRDYDLSEEISVILDGMPVYLKIDGSERQSIEIKTALTKLKPSTGNVRQIPPLHRVFRFISKFIFFKHYFKDTWLLTDRDIQADDNAEHLYRYLLQEQPDIKAFFIIRKSSHDWQRLKRAGFKLIGFGSIKHRLALLNTRYLVSSHVDNYVVNYLTKEYYGDLLSYDFIFLQHGVTQNDLSKWLNRKAIDLIITSTKKEFQSIADDFSPYKYSEKEVVLTGFPRHDSLLNYNKQKTDKIILIMPTWRKNLVGRPTGSSNERSYNPEFINSVFALGWKKLLHAKKMKELAERFGYRVVFYPHANLKPYKEWFSVPAHIKHLDHEAGNSIQDLFHQAACLITDYSSTAFEMAYLFKPVIYYQFDDNIFVDGHVFTKGYFDYYLDGFGPVCSDQTSLLSALENTLAADCKPGPDYLERMKNTFAFRDGKCCERVFKAIQNREISYMKNCYKVKGFANPVE